MDHDFPDFGFKGTTKPTFNSSPILEPSYDDVFGGLPKYPNKSPPFNFDSAYKDSNSKAKPSSNLPVFDKPLYDNDDDGGDGGGGGDIFDGVPGLKTKNGPSSSVKFENNVFSSSSAFDDLLGNLGKKEMSASGRKKWGEVDTTNGSAFDDLLPGFGANSPPQDRVTPGTTQPQQSSVASRLSSSSFVENPFVVLESASGPAYESPSIFAESLEQIDKDNQSSNRKVDISSVQGEIFDTDPIVNMAKSQPIFSSGSNNSVKDANGLGTNPYGTHKSTVREPSGEPSENASRRKVSFDDFQKSHQSRFSIPNVSSDSHHAFTQNGSHANSSSETNSDTGMSPMSDDNLEAADDIWLTVSEITLTTLPTRVPPPSRPAPPRPQQNFRDVKGFSFANIKKPDDFSPFYPSSQSYGRPRTVPDTVKSPGVSSIDGLADFAMARPQSDVNERVDDTSNQEDTENSSAAASAAAMKEAVERAEAKFKHAREVREKENAAKNSGIQQEREEKVTREFNERDLKEKQERLDHEQEQRERDEKDREQRRIEKEREQAREIEMQRETGRQAVDRAMKEVRERAAAEARQKAQRAAVGKVNAEARERAERAAVQRAQAEARERAAKEARLRAEKAAAEAKERKNAEDNEKTAAAASAEEDARIRAGRASVNRATAEARERAAAAAASAAAAAATRGNQRKSENDLDSFFNSSARPDTAPKPRSSSSDSAFDAHFQNRAGPEGVQRSSSATSSGVRKEYSTPNIGDDLTSFFASTPPSGDSRENVGESDERRRARLERDQRTQKRAEKALAEKNERDRHTQWEQAERQRIAESLDFEIKRWSAGKEGNLRAMLSTLQYVLWPECGWQPVSLTDLITSASVKKVYRKATLCIHPDKVQQKGASLQQKYIAEKVFDMLKEAWNKLNSEELF